MIRSSMLVALLLVAAPLHAQSLDRSPSAMWPVIAALAGGAGDVISTQYGLAAGGYEMNPLLPSNRVGNALLLSASYIGDALLARYLIHHGHPAIGRLIGYGSGLSGGAGMTHNLSALPHIHRPLAR